jgi:hypothetical protein
MYGQGRGGHMCVAASVEQPLWTPTPKPPDPPSSPPAPQPRTFLGSARKSAKSKTSEAGMLSVLTCAYVCVWGGGGGGGRLGGVLVWCMFLLPSRQELKSSVQMGDHPWGVPFTGGVPPMHKRIVGARSCGSQAYLTSACRWSP